jgi:hypothetical protein
MSGICQINGGVMVLGVFEELSTQDDVWHIHKALYVVEALMVSHGK